MKKMTWEFQTTIKMDVPDDFGIDDPEKAAVEMENLLLEEVVKPEYGIVVVTNKNLEIE